ncbi:MAG: restriction endonuclease subunit S [Acidimicrobiales bacterium]
MLTLDQIESGAARLVGNLNEAESSGGIRFQPGDVLFSKLRPYLAKSLLVDRPMHGTGELLAMKVGPELDARFLLYTTLSQPWLDRADLTAYGSKMPRTSWEAMADIQLPELALDQQRRIVDFLDDQGARIDNIIAARHHQQALIAEALTSRLAELFFVGSTVPMRRLVREAVVGIVVQPARYYVDARFGVRALRGLNVGEGEIFMDNLVEISHEGHGLHPRSQLTAGDVVVVRTGDAGSACVVPEWSVGWNCIDLVIVRANNTATPQYIEHAINAARRNTTITAAASGSIQQHFGVGALLDLPVRWCRVDGQIKVVIAADEARDNANVGSRVLAESVKRLGELKRSLITAAVTGEFDVLSADGSRVSV